MKTTFQFDTRNSDFVMTMNCKILTTKQDKKVEEVTCFWANVKVASAKNTSESQFSPLLTEKKHCCNVTFNSLIIN